jgi:hypothetical protein
VVNALTKSIGGHGNALGGSLTDTGAYDWANYPHIAANYKKQPQNMWGMAQVRAKGLRDFGASLGPEAAHHIAVGAETLALRMERTSSNALALARMLEADPRVAAVHYPGLASHPQHGVATELFKACGSLFSFELKDGIDCFDYLNRLKVAISASNLGDSQQPGRHAHPGDPGGAHDLLRDGRRAARQHGDRRIADPGIGGHRGPRGFAGRLQGGAGRIGRWRLVVDVGLRPHPPYAAFMDADFGPG